MFLVIASIPMAAAKEHPAHPDHPEHPIVPLENTQHLRDNAHPEHPAHPDHPAHIDDVAEDNDDVDLPDEASDSVPPEVNEEDDADVSNPPVDQTPSSDSLKNMNKMLVARET